MGVLGKLRLYNSRNQNTGRRVQKHIYICKIIDICTENQIRKKNMTRGKDTGAHLVRGRFATV